MGSETTLLAYLSHAKSNCDRADDKALLPSAGLFSPWAIPIPGIKTSDKSLPSNVKERTSK